MTEDIKTAIDTRLACVHLSAERCAAAAEKPRVAPRAVRRAAAALCAVCVFGGATAWAAVRLFGLRVNGAQIPALEPMTVVETLPCGAAADGASHPHSSLESLSQALGVPLLWADGARENPYALVSHQNFGDDYQIVEAQAYLTGDVTDLAYVDEYGGHYAWTPGAVYQTPVDLRLEWVSSTDQQPFDHDYLGYYAYVETRTSAQGYTVNFLRETTPGAGADGRKPECAAVFVADGVRYTLSGNVTLETMRAIVDSMA